MNGFRVPVAGFQPVRPRVVAPAVYMAPRGDTGAAMAVSSFVSAGGPATMSAGGPAVAAGSMRTTPPGTEGRRFESVRGLLNHLGTELSKQNWGSNQSDKRALLEHIRRRTHMNPIPDGPLSLEASSCSHTGILCRVQAAGKVFYVTTSVRTQTITVYTSIDVLSSEPIRGFLKRRRILRPEDMVLFRGGARFREYLDEKTVLLRRGAPRSGRQ